MLASVVSSRMLRAIALAEGVEYYDALTGKKYRAPKGWGNVLPQRDGEMFCPKGMGKCFSPKGWGIFFPERDGEMFCPKGMGKICVM